MKKINDSEAADSDKIARNLLKVTADIDAPPLTQTFYKLIVDGIFPSEYKLARETPIFKKGKITVFLFSALKC